MMSSGFSDREKAFESKWAHNEELRFHVLARRNKLLGLWVAGEMGERGPAAEDYAKAVVQAELTKAGDEAVFEKIRGDLAAAKIARTDHLIRTKMDEFLAIAKNEVIGEG
jgi:hypothetical protein